MQGEKGKSISQLQHERVKKLVEIGEMTYAKIRKGEISNPNLVEISKDISELDKHIFIASKETKESYCPNCNEKLVGEVKFCGKCGTNIKDYYENKMTKCAVCGELTPKESKFCMVCGRKMD
ncbi:zinc ribbon domain-containing protein [Caldisalinibacter kiritimatiensis]|uniref:DZANK-type domain-containing protein n=1 Tax=Caldisalinibacter kiritimatiensis TaxID=1304284 RepID=R1CRQ1_9FIRM|nr:zinc ribbon domain-containing protein [Caldisalinibacter kiritimatiensis]EOC99378.1 hypothetical protein L21TH_2636 [Caldisalinibacter kiritimatiensis]